ncbi:MAG: GNAT family N-acetyltransferase [Alphaproteobacteria bacterium]|nr:GNAT family N-acetyltransferase [Alphaproteobacteria bacterium]MCL2505239.1 GNAT family N-acetyltransferase [Alphaproteobacteria bacterium]
MNIRTAQETDFKFILQANRDINAHSHLGEMDLQNQNRLKQDLFGENPKCWAVIAEIDNKPVGMALYSTTYWTNNGQIMWVSQIYTSPEYRHQGIATELNEKLCEIAALNGWSRVCCGIEETNLASQKTFIRAGGKVLRNHNLCTWDI